VHRTSQPWACRLIFISFSNIKIVPFLSNATTATVEATQPLMAAASKELAGQHMRNDSPFLDADEK
jgi:hypothetical protein